jgi:WD40 repeat protein
MIFNSAIVDAIKFTYKEPFEPLFEKGAHSGSIVALALTPTKTIAGTLSTDKSVKFWNFSADQKLVLSFHFHENELAFDIHP